MLDMRIYYIMSFDLFLLNLEIEILRISKGYSCAHRGAILYLKFITIFPADEQTNSQRQRLALELEKKLCLNPEIHARIPQLSD